ncbi:hypothetical protein AWB67_06264 [Caballeronia terrestris]|uniref:Uncharacterized protein n=1 Tax=Caballeronia terrestris TaxID=1226301 RepID=A0A158KP52_9BURK|nr:hypothetical protein [Caballeronia terrestris]SAL82926.1 hypothetical protein AWB67_06264 [Caballeronia terrestris]
MKDIVSASAVLSACVQILGAQEDVLPFVVASDTLVLPSAFEGVPLVMIEAVLAQRPLSRRVCLALSVIYLMHCSFLPTIKMHLWRGYLRLERYR